MFLSLIMSDVGCLIQKVIRFGLSWKLVWCQPHTAWVILSFELPDLLFWCLWSSDSCDCSLEGVDFDFVQLIFLTTVIRVFFSCKHANRWLIATGDWCNWWRHYNVIHMKRFWWRFIPMVLNTMQWWWKEYRFWCWRAFW